MEGKKLFLHGFKSFFPSKPPYFQNQPQRALPFDPVGRGRGEVGEEQGERGLAGGRWVMFTIGRLALLRTVGGGGVYNCWFYFAATGGLWAAPSPVLGEGECLFGRYGLVFKC